jgi:hypothetical protein
VNFYGDFECGFMFGLHFYGHEGLCFIVCIFNVCCVLGALMYAFSF